VPADGEEVQWRAHDEVEAEHVHLNEGEGWEEGAEVEGAKIEGAEGEDAEGARVSGLCRRGVVC
jgi:hypothetical protein